MPVPVQRDPEQTRRALADWLAARSPRAGEVEVGPVRVPGAAGFSGEILMCDAEWTGSGPPRREPLAVRVAPTGHRVHPDDRWADQVRLLEVLDGTDVPVAPLLGHEPDPSVLGAPFLVMRRIEGRVPADLPSYHREGWLAALPPHRRRAVWLGGVEMLAAIHRLDPDALGLGFLDRPRYGTGHLTQQLAEYTRFLPFYGADGNRTATTALAWLHEHRPEEPAPPRLLWGDARLGNIVYDGETPAAVLDWEMAALGRPESDLAWFLHLDRHLSEGIGAVRLAGLPGRAETVRHYERLTGHAVRDLEYYEVFAAFRFCVLTARVTRLLEESGIMPPGTDFPLHRNATRLLARVLEEAADRCGGTAVPR
ncbi:phosphotransferase family protein [Streptomyces pilosus]|uniref:phosphotransferase family protein n=1 Tax=Streptomyces pilosus TaxID=28893 RepID=UPI0016719857|nr:phosphotransferase family protein [Streptomyces pilosus]GGV69002.1 aminoglycoside phosphotransferase [Streptomyces pilosus]